MAGVRTDLQTLLCSAGHEGRQNLDLGAIPGIGGCRGVRTDLGTIPGAVAGGQATHLERNTEIQPSASGEQRRMDLGMIPWTGGSIGLGRDPSTCLEDGGE